MANPIKMRQHANGLYNDGVQIMSTGDMDYAAKLLLTEFSGSTNETGDLWIDTAGGTAVGTFTDYYYVQALGTHAGNTLTSKDHVFKQNTASTTEALTRPVTSDGTTVAPASDTDLNASIIDRALDRIALANTTFAERGTYYLSTSSPSIGGTWVEKGSFTDKVTNDAADSAYTVTFKLWRKTSDTISSDVIRPMKLSGASSLYEMTDAEIKTLESRFRNRIIATGVGKYELKVGVAAPSGGTWVARGTATARVPTVSSVQYTGTYANQFTAQYTRQVPGPQYARATPGPAYAVNFTREYGAQYTNQYLRGTLYTRAEFARAQYNVQFTRATPGPQYTRNIAGPQYTSTYGGNPYTRQVTGPQYTDTNQYTRAVVGPNYARATPGPNYSVQYGVQYARVVTGPQYSRSRPGPNYAVNYTREYSVNYGVNFQRTYFRSFGRVYSGSYSRAIPVTYTGQYEGAYSRSVTGPQYAETGYARLVVGPAYTSPAYARTYWGVYWRAYWYNDNAGPEPVGDPYTNLRPGPSYSNQYTRFFVGQYGTGTFSRSFISSYFGPAVPAGTGWWYAQNGTVTEFWPDPDYTYYRVEEFDGETWFSRIGFPYQRNQKPYTRVVVQSYTSPQYGRTFSGSYSGNYDRSRPDTVYASYARSRPGPQYSVGYNGPTYSVSYTRVNTGPNYGVAYERVYAGQYTRIYSAQYERQFSRSFGRVYSGQYERVYSAQYSGQFTRVYSATYTPGFSRTFAREYFAQYQRVYSAQYTVQYSRLYASQFERSFANQYARNITGPQYAVNYDRTYSAQYARTYLGQYSRTQTGQFTGQYAGDTINSTFTSTTYTLWLRVA